MICGYENQQGGAAQVKSRIALLQEMGLSCPYTDSCPIDIVEAEFNPLGSGGAIRHAIALGDANGAAT